jgi:hypothetical protein
MYTAIVAGILFFPWTLVGLLILGCLAHRRKLACSISEHREAGRGSKPVPRF